MTKRLTVNLFPSQPHAKRAQPRLWAFGHLALAEAGNCGVCTVRRAIKAGTLNPSSFVSIYNWLESRKVKL